MNHQTTPTDPHRPLSATIFDDFTINDLHNLPSLSHPLVDESRVKLLKSINYLSTDEQKTVMRACAFGDVAHIKDKRKSGEPYITHPIAVAEILANFQLDKDTLVAGILHDTVEDTEVSLQLLSDKFGDVVATLVDGVTKLKSNEMSQQESQAATFHKIITATIADPRVLIVKLSDRLHNMSTLDAVRPEKQQRTAKETLSFYVPLARVLGLNDIADSIELFCYRNLNEKMYLKLSDKLLQQRLGRRYQQTAIQTYLQNILNELGLNGMVHVLDNKTAMYRQFFNNRGNIDELVYQHEFEVVVDSIDACDKLAYYLIEQHNIGNEGIFDHIRKPLPGGNQSLTLHYDANQNHIKITLLTQRMQQSARLGIIGQDGELSQSVIQASLRNLQDLTCNDNIINAIDELLGYLNERKIICYSPKGRAYELPRGSTALDFAYAVGPSVGNIATGATINDTEGKLGQVLTQGDIVQIHTDSKAMAQANWLGFVATNKARKEILKALKKLSSTAKIEQGKYALNTALKTYGKTLEELSDSDWHDILAWRGVDSQDALFAQIIDGKLLPQLVVSRLFSDEIDHSEETAITKSKHLIAGVKGIEVNFARCCNPIYGDAIVGHLSSKHGLNIHRHKCYELSNIRKDNPYQVIQLHWKPSIDDNHNDKFLRFSAFIKIPMLLNEEQLSQVIYEMKALNIGIETTNSKHNAQNTGATILHLVVRSRQHLHDGIDKLRHLLDYKNIERLYRD